MTNGKLKQMTVTIVNDSGLIKLCITTIIQIITVTQGLLVLWNGHKTYTISQL